MGFQVQSLRDPWDFISQMVFVELLLTGDGGGLFPRILAYWRHSGMRTCSPAVAMSSVAVDQMRCAWISLPLRLSFIQFTNAFSIKSNMSDLLNSLKPHARYNPRPQAAFVRAQKLLNTGSDTPINHILPFNLPSLLRLRDSNPSIYVCAMMLLELNVPEEPVDIRRNRLFHTLLEILKVDEERDHHKVSLILLEVFTYMIIIHRARNLEEANREAGRAASSSLYEEEELVT